MREEDYTKGEAIEVDMRKSVTYNMKCHIHNMAQNKVLPPQVPMARQPSAFF